MQMELMQRNLERKALVKVTQKAAIEKDKANRLKQVRASYHNRIAKE